HEPDNLVTLCAGHHTALHAGQLSIEGRPSTTLRFLRADGTRYTEAPSARAVAVGKQVVGALRGLGFSERDSRTAVARVLEAAETRCSAALLRAALAVLGASLSGSSPVSVRDGYGRLQVSHRARASVRRGRDGGE